MRDTERETEAETQAEGEAGSMPGARCRTRSWDPRVGSWCLGIKSHIRLPTGSLLLPLPVSLPLSLSV